MTILFFNILKGVVGLMVFAFGILTYIKNKSSKVNKSFLFLTFSIFVWTAFYCFAHFQINASHALGLFKIGYLGIIFIPYFFYNFIYALLKVERYKFIHNVALCFAIVFSCLLFLSDCLLVDIKEYAWGFYPVVSKVGHPVFLFYFFALFTMGFIYLLYNLIILKGSSNLIYLARIKYVFIGSVFTTFASIDFFPNYGVDIWPIGFLGVIPFPIFFTYAIIRYRLMDVSLVITRTGIFIGVYSAVLGLPFIQVFIFQQALIKHFNDVWWFIPLVTSTVLAFVGPFVYLFIQRKAEIKLFQEQHRYQMTLRQASVGMGRIKDLNRLVLLIVHIVTRTVRLQHTIVYLTNKDSKNFDLVASKSRNIRFSPAKYIKFDSELVKTLNESHNPIIYDEIRQQSEDRSTRSLTLLEKELYALNASLVVPSYIEDKLLAVIVLGDKLSGAMYTPEDLNVFSILANQAALAIENAQFYEDMKETHEQLFKAEKMATIGTMADGLSHQINNRLHALGFIAGDLLDTIQLKKKNGNLSPDMKEILVDIEHGLSRIQENVAQGGDVVRGLLKYTRKGEEGMGLVDLNELLDSALEMTQFKIKPGQMQILREFKADIPKIKGNFTQLQEVFFNLIDNAFDAMMQRKEELKEEGYKAIIRISAESAGNSTVNIYVKDSGIGIKDDDTSKLFTPFFTTKLSSKKGTGLGLYVIQKLIEENHGGKVKYASKYGEGTTVTLKLPTMDET